MTGVINELPVMMNELPVESANHAGTPAVVVPHLRLQFLNRILKQA